MAAWLGSDFPTPKFAPTTAQAGSRGVPPVLGIQRDGNANAQLIACNNEKYFRKLSTELLMKSLVTGSSDTSEKLSLDDYQHKKIFPSQLSRLGRENMIHHVS